MSDMHAPQLVLVAGYAMVASCQWLTTHSVTCSFPFPLAPAHREQVPRGFASQGEGYARSAHCCRWSWKSFSNGCKYNGLSHCSNELLKNLLQESTYSAFSLISVHACSD